MSDNLARGGSPAERPAGESSYGPCGAPSCTMAWTATVRALEAEVERLRRGLNQIRSVTDDSWAKNAITVLLESERQ